MSFAKLIKSNVAIVTATVVTVLGIFAVAWFTLSPVSGNFSPDPLSSTTVATSVPSLNGDWSETTNGIVLIATVKNNTIIVQLKSDDTMVTYWKGTFISDAKSGQQVASVKDTTTAIFNASDSKIFTIGDGTISFEMSAMGVTKTMVLSHV